MNDRIDYKWGYMLQQPNVCNNSSTTQVTGEFSYSYGSVSCSVANSACANNATIDVTYSSCRFVDLSQSNISRATLID